VPLDNPRLTRCDTSVAMRHGIPYYVRILWRFGADRDSTHGVRIEGVKVSSPLSSTTH
jgi:hypothetical protein